MVPVVFYTVATLVLTYPIIAQLTTHIPNQVHGDGFEAVRLIWWSKEALLRGMHPAYQPLLVYPEGFFSAVHWAAPLSQLAGVPFALLFSPLVAYNLTFLSAWVLTGLAAYLFCWELTRQQGGALLGGLVLMAFPTRQGHAAIGHLTLITNYWLLLYVWSLVRFWRRPGWRTGALAGLLLVLTAGTAVTNLPYELAPVTAVYGGLMLWRHRRAWRRWLRPGLVYAAVAALGILFLYGPLMIGVWSGQIENLEAAGTVDFSTDLLGFITPSPFNRMLQGAGLVPGWAGDVLGRDNNTTEEAAYLGVVAVSLAALALWRRRAEAIPWLLTGLTGMILSLGPVLKVDTQVVEVSIGDRSSPIPLPYALYEALPGMGLGRTPGRLNMVTGVALAALAAYGLTALLARWPRLDRPVWQTGLVISLAALILVEYPLFIPFLTSPAPMPAYFETLAQDAARGIVRPVLDVPANDFRVMIWQLYFQTAHHQPLLSGHVVRQTPANHAMLRMVDMAALPPVKNGLVPSLTLEQQAAILRASGAQIVVVHRDRPDGPTMAAHLVQVLGEPVYDDAQVTIFEVTEGPLPDRVLFALDGTWDASSQPMAWWLDGAALDGWWLGEMRQQITSALPAVFEGPWAYEASSSLVNHWLRVDISSNFVEYRQSPPGPTGDGILWRFAVYFPAGGFQYARFWTDADVAGCALLPQDDVCQRELVRRPQTAAEQTALPLNVDFGDGQMRLVSTEVRYAGPGRYALNAYWQALGAERADYTMFVHLLNERGELIAQWDGPVGGLNAHTSQWATGDIRVQEAVLEYPEDLPPGVYQLYIGLYTYPDVTRLTVHSPRPRAQDGLLYLGEVVLPLSSRE